MEADRATRLIEQLISNPASSESDGRSLELLAEYGRGSPVVSLRTLLLSPDDRLAGEGAWIASELSELGKPLLPDVKGLLQHHSMKVRFWAVDCVHLWAGSSDGSELSCAVSLLDDPEKAVRWKAMGFVGRASRSQLQGALEYFRLTDPTSVYLAGLAWLVCHGGAQSEEIIAALRDHDPRCRKFAVAAALRLAKDDSEPLRQAVHAADPEIAAFARDMLAREPFN